MAQSTSAGMTGASQLALMPLITGFMTSRIIQVAAELGIADLLAKGPTTIEGLSAQTTFRQWMCRRAGQLLPASSADACFASLATI